MQHLASKSGRLIQQRALQCSFTSIFHLRSTSESMKERKTMVMIEKIFLYSVSFPLGLMVAAGCISSLNEERKKEEMKGSHHM